MKPLDRGRRSPDRVNVSGDDRRMVAATIRKDLPYALRAALRE
jgi:hypothetical protein